MINLKELEKTNKKKIAKLAMIVGQLWNREMYVYEIKRKLGLSYPLTSKYLSDLKKAGIIRIEREEEARGIPRKYFSVNIEAIVDFLAEKSNLSPDEKRILLKDAFSASKAINTAPNLSDTMLPKSINPRLILMYPFITVWLLDFLYGQEPEVKYLQKAGFNSSEIRSLQTLHRRLIKCFPFPTPQLSIKERDWFRNKENRRVRKRALMKILPCRDSKLKPILEFQIKFNDILEDMMEREIDFFAKFRTLVDRSGLDDENHVL